MSSGNSIDRFAAIFSVGAIFGLLLEREKRESKNRELGLNQVSDAKQQHRANGIPSSLTPEKNSPTSGDDHSKPQKTKHTLLEKAAVLMAVIAVFATIWQGWLALDTERRSLRAYLGVLPPTLQCPDCANALYQDPSSGPVLTPNLLTFVVKVVGQTPAYDVHVRHVDWEPITYIAPYQFGNKFVAHPNFANVIESRTTILPSDTAPFRVAIQVAYFRPAKFEGGRLLVYGGFDYQDIFGKTWTKEFCFIYKGAGAQDTFTTCPEHNGDHESEPMAKTP